MPPSRPVTPEAQDNSPNAISEQGEEQEEEKEEEDDDESILHFRLSDAESPSIMTQSLSFSHPPRCRLVSPKERSMSEPTFAIPDPMRFNREVEETEGKFLTEYIFSSTDNVAPVLSLQKLMQVYVHSIWSQRLT